MLGQCKHAVKPCLVDVWQLICFPWRAYTARSTYFINIYIDTFVLTSPTEKNYLILKHKIIFPLRSIKENFYIHTDDVIEEGVFSIWTVCLLSLLDATV